MASTVVWRISKEHFDGNVKRKLSLSNAMSEQLAQQFRIYSDRVDNLEYKNADERVIYRLLFLAGRFGVREGRDIVIDAPITHDMFAHSINLARESVTRSLKRLSDLRLIDNNRRNIRIKDVEALASHLSRPVNLENWGLDTLPKSVNGAASLSWNELRHRFNK